MRNEQKNNNAYLVSILTIILLASSIPLLNTAQADMSDNVTLIGDSSNKSFSSPNGTVSYTVKITTTSDFSLVMGLRYLENSTVSANPSDWGPNNATFIYNGQLSTGNLTLDAESGTHIVSISISILSNSDGFFQKYPDRWLARFGFAAQLLVII